MSIAKRVRDMHALASNLCDPEFNRALFDAAYEIERLRGAMRKIRDGLADTGSTPGKRMTLITKADAYEIARDALLDE